MMALQLPLILVTGSYLGTISHTLTALDSLYRRDMNVLAIIVSETPSSTVPLDDTVAAIARFAEPVIGAAAQQAPGRRAERRTAARPHYRPAGPARALNGRSPTLFSGHRGSEQMLHLRHGFQHAFEIEQRMEQERQQRRA